jgi:hypothetical protein
MIKPLGDLTWRDHKSALWWLGLLYRRPHRFLEELQELSQPRALFAGLLVLGQALPYVLAIAGLSRWFLVGLIDASMKEPALADISDFQRNATALVRGIALAVPVGVGLGIAVGIAFGTASLIAFGRGYFEGYREGLSEAEVAVSLSIKWHFLRSDS